MSKVLNSVIYLLLIKIFVIVALTSSASAQGVECANMIEVLRQPQFVSLNEVQKHEATASANWSEEGHIVSFCYEKSCFITKVCTPDPRIIDISGVVGGNLGKIGLNPEYDRIENRPLLTSKNWNEILAEWLGDKSILTRGEVFPQAYGTYIRTRIWKDDQRYTVYEPIRISGEKPIYR